jgi:zinc transporter 7
VQDLNTYKLATSPQTSTLTSRIFAILFPGSPAINALLATLYISGPPNFLLALCPPNIDPSSLSVMVAFAVGGLLGDTLFHLLPEIFLGEDSPQHVRFVMVEPNRNLLLGVAIMVGFVTFVAMDKGLRIATGGEGHDHSHGNVGKVEEVEIKAVMSSGKTSALDGSPAKSTRSRKKDTISLDENGNAEVVVVKEVKEINASVKLAGYLNLMYVSIPSFQGGGM